MQTRCWWLVLGALAGCDERGALVVAGALDSDTDPIVDASDAVSSDTDVDCDNPVVRWEPVGRGSVDRPIGAVLTRPEPDATLRLRDGSRDVPGTTRVRDEVVGFVPGGEVPAGTSVEARLTWSCGVATHTFETAAPVFRLTPLDPDLDDWLPRLSQLSSLRLGLVGASPRRTTWRVALSDSPCTTTFELSGDRDDNRLTLQGVGLQRVGEAPFVVDLELTARAGPDLRSLSEVVLGAPFPLEPLGATDAACPGLAGEGVACVACRTGRCAALAIGLRVEREGDEGVAARTEDDIAADPACP